MTANRLVYASPLPQTAPYITTPDDLAAKINTGPTYTVDKLLRHRTTDNVKAEFLVKWFAYRTPNWMKRTHIREELISQHFTRLREQTGAIFDSHGDTLLISYTIFTHRSTGRLVLRIRHGYGITPPYFYVYGHEAYNVCARLRASNSRDFIKACAPDVDIIPQYRSRKNQNDL